MQPKKYAEAYENTCRCKGFSQAFLDENLYCNTHWLVHLLTYLLTLLTYLLTDLLTYLLTYSMKQSPFWEANRFAASQEIPHVPTTSFYPEPAKSSPYTHILLIEDPS
jgi:hypothetical protein